MSNQLATRDDTSVIESVVIGGDLSRLTPEQRVNYYQAVCKSLGLNPLTKPFDYITLNSKLTLYARKDCADQLRKINEISIDKPDIRFEDDWIIVTITAKDARGRIDSDLGVVNRKDMRGDFGNALMKAVTKAKRRVTLSICGLGMLDETEVETIPDARPVIVAETGEIRPPSPQPAAITNGIPRPYSPDVLRDKLTQRAALPKNNKTVSQAQRGLVAACIEKAFAGPGADKIRHTVVNYLFGVTSLNDVPAPAILAMLNDWLNPTKDTGGDYQPDPMAIRELHAVHSAAERSAGQLEMPLDGDIAEPPYDDDTIPADFR